MRVWGLVIVSLMGSVMGFTSTNDVTSLAVLSNSLFAWAIASTISGTFDGPQTKSAMSIATITSPSNPESGNPLHRHEQRSAPYKNGVSDYS